MTWRMSRVRTAAAASPSLKVLASGRALLSGLGLLRQRGNADRRHLRVERGEDIGGDVHVVGAGQRRLGVDRDVGTAGGHRLIDDRAKPRVELLADMRLG